MPSLYPILLRRLYTFVYWLAIPAILLRLLWRSRHNPAYRQRWPERFGFTPIASKPSIWLHAVSLGESVAATPLIHALLKQFPEHQLIITNTTPTGSAHIQKTFAQQVAHFYLPYDLPNCVNRFLQRGNVQLAIFMETEMWPNVLACCKKKDIPVILANGRLSQRSLKKYQKISTLARAMLQNYHLAITQSQQDGERFLSLGLPRKRLMVSGNIKFDIELPPELLSQGKKLREQWESAQRPTWVAASTHEGEEVILLDAFQKVLQRFPTALLIIVPRHPDRFSRVKEIIQQRQLSLAQRSLEQTPMHACVFLGDTMGELRLWYAAADVAFVGGTLIPVGGHSLIEPAAFGLPILSGPNLQNCTEIADLLEKAGALKIFHDAHSIANHVIQLFSEVSLKEETGKQARQVVEKNRGALEKHLRCISQLL